MNMKNYDNSKMNSTEMTPNRNNSTVANSDCTPNNYSKTPDQRQSMSNGSYMFMSPQRQQQTDRGVENRVNPLRLNAPKDAQTKVMNENHDHLKRKP
jgi:hypothetical protein